MYEIVNLYDVNFEDLAHVHNIAFSDYVTPMQTTPEQLEAYFKVAGVDCKQSFGAYYQNKLIGILANAVDYYRGGMVAWDAITGIAKEHRGKGLFSKLFESTRECLKSNGINRYFLDVITANENACTVYKKKGAQIEREFSFLTGRTDSQFGSKMEVKITPLSSSHKDELAYYDPSFGNRIVGLCRDYDNYQVLEAENVAVIISKQGRISQIRYAGTDETEQLCSILTYLSQKFDNLSISNIPITEISLIHALLQNNFRVKLNQYEMSMEL